MTPNDVPPASSFVIQGRTSSVSILSLPSLPLNMKDVDDTSKICLASSQRSRPPIDVTRYGRSTPRPQRAASSWWMPWLPMSPLPYGQAQCQL